MLSDAAQVLANGDVEEALEAKGRAPRVANNVVGNLARQVEANDLDGVVSIGFAMKLNHATQIVLPTGRVHCHCQWAMVGQQFHHFQFAVDETVLGMGNLISFFN